MTSRPQFHGIAALALGAALLSACAPVVDRQGYVMDEVLTSAIQPGVDNRDSVAAALGRPTFTGQFDESEWYYVSRVTSNMAFNMPRPAQQTVLKIRFDPAGNVAAVERTGMDQVASISPSGETTPTLGRGTNFFRELFGNIGASRAEAGRGTADNPQ